MKNKIYILGIIVITLLLTACEKYLDRELVDDLTYEQVTSVFSYSRSRVAAVYNGLQPGFSSLDGAMMASASDEAEHTLEASDVQMFNVGSWSAFTNPDDVWAHYYRAIRKANQVLVSLDDINLDEFRLDPDPSKQEVYQQRLAEINRWKYEVRFLRAFFYFELVKRYGGVPLLTSALSMDDNTNAIQRNSLAECIQFITDECDAAASVLPSTYDNVDLGRATKIAAMALKSKVLLYAASDLFNTPSWASGYPAELISLTGDRQARWQAAADAAKAVIDSAADAGYGLISSYNDLFDSRGYREDEVLFCRREGSSNDFEKANYPIGYDMGQSGTTPSQNLVDAYEMSNGKEITDPTSGYDPQNPYADRDPRLAMTVITNNSSFKGRPVECWQEGRDGPPVPNATKTGYYLKKFVNENLDLIQGTSSVHTWIYIRLAEIYLNYAEALNECDPGNADIKMYVDMVRMRDDVGMPALPGSLDQAQMRDKIRHERRIEFAFEGHRFWDLRRWMLAPTVLSGPLKGMQITKNADGTFNYGVINVENRVFDTKMYLYPIPQNEILSADGLVQNPLW